MRRYLAAAVTAVILGWFVWVAVVTQDVGKIFLLLRSTKVSFYLVFLLLAFAALVLSTSNLYLLLTRFKNAPGWKRVFELDLLSLFGTYYTPGGSGGLAFLVYMLKKDGVDPEDSSSCLVVDKFITAFLALCSFALVIIAYLPPRIVQFNWQRFTLFCTAAGACCAASVAIPAVRRVMASLLARLAVFRRHPGIIFANVFITLGVFSLSASQFALAFRSLGVKPPDFGRLLVTYGAISIIGYLPFTISGAGVSEAVAIAIWKGPQLSSEEIIAAFVVARLFTLVSTFVLPGLVYAGRWCTDRTIKLHANRF